MLVIEQCTRTVYASCLCNWTALFNRVHAFVVHCAELAVYYFFLSKHVTIGLFTFLVF